MAEAIVYVPNTKGVKELLTSPGVNAALLDIAEEVADTARGLAPVDSGEYKRSIIARLVEGRSERSAAEVAAEVEYATAVEARDRVLGRSLP